MVFKFATFDPAQDPDDFNHAFPQSSASSLSAAAATSHQPCDSTDGCIRALVGQLVVAGTSHISTFQPRHSCALMLIFLSSVLVPVAPKVPLA